MSLVQGTVNVVSTSEDESSSDDSEEEVIYRDRSVSLASITSALGIAGLSSLSTSNFITAPQVSTTSLQCESQENLDKTKKEFTEADESKTLSFTRKHLQKRLSNLVKLSERNSSDDPEVNFETFPHKFT